MRQINRHAFPLFIFLTLVWIAFNHTYYQGVDLHAIPDLYRIAGLGINGAIILLLAFVMMRWMKVTGRIFIVKKYPFSTGFTFFSGNAGTLAQHLTVNTDFEFIKYAAVRHPNGNIFAVSQPGRHGDVMRAMHEEGMAGIDQTMDQGFVTSYGRYVDREVGLTIANDRRQIVRKHPSPDELYSEDMWPDSY